MVRFLACEEDSSDEAPDKPSSERVAIGADPVQIISAMAGG